MTKHVVTTLRDLLESTDAQIRRLETSLKHHLDGQKLMQLFRVVKRLGKKVNLHIEKSGTSANDGTYLIDRISTTRPLGFIGLSVTGNPYKEHASGKKDSGAYFWLRSKNHSFESDWWSINELIHVVKNIEVT